MAITEETLKKMESDARKRIDSLKESKSKLDAMVQSAKEVEDSCLENGVSLYGNVAPSEAIRKLLDDVNEIITGERATIQLCVRLKEML